MACLAWGIFAPVGAVVLRTLPVPYALRGHAIWQTLTYCMYTAAVGTGLWLVITIERVSEDLATPSREEKINLAV